MIKHKTCSTMALLGLLAVAPVSFASTFAPLPTGLSITENFDALNFIGSYDVALAPDAGFSLTGFGVSNGFGVPSIDNLGNPDPGCVPGVGGLYCYFALQVTADNWDSESAIGGSNFQTFEQVFGAFSDNVAPGELTINWYGAFSLTGGEEDALEPGQSSDPGFFLFTSEVPGSVALGVTRDAVTGEYSSFSNAAVVPIPAAAWLFGSGLLGLIGVARRKKA